MKSVILVISGMPGAGKTTASHFFQKSQVPILKMGDLTDQVLKNKKIPISEKSEDTVRNDLRKKYGSDIYVKSLFPKLGKLIKMHNLVVIEGARSSDELRTLKAKCKRVSLIYIKSTKKIRYIRLAKRTRRPLDESDARMRDEWEKQTGSQLLMKQADVIVENNGTKEAFLKRLNEIMGKFK